jgi:cyclase
VDSRKLIACFDVINGRVTKALKFFDNIDVASAEELAEVIKRLGEFLESYRQ